MLSSSAPRRCAHTCGASGCKEGWLLMARTCGGGGGGGGGAGGLIHEACPHPPLRAPAPRLAPWLRSVRGSPPLCFDEMQKKKRKKKKPRTWPRGHDEKEEGRARAFWLWWPRGGRQGWRGRGGGGIGFSLVMETHRRGEAREFFLWAQGERMTHTGMEIISTSLK